jgi:hypothetical protein
LARIIAKLALSQYRIAMVRILLGHRLAVMALLLATFVVIPMADAVLCASESVDTHSYVDLHDDDGDSRSNKGSGADYEHDACSHCHCHHTHAHVSPNFAPKTASLQLAHAWPDSDAIASHTPDGLRRPPKA